MNLHEGNLKRYSFEVIDTNGCCKPVAEILSSDMMAVFNKVAEISEEITQPGHRIQVKDQNGDAVFVGVMTLQVQRIRAIALPNIANDPSISSRFWGHFFCS